MHHSGVDALVQRELISTALTLSSVLSGLVCSLVCGVWAKAALGADHPQWWQACVAGFVIGFGSVSLVSVTVEAGTNALFVCYAEDPAPLAAISTPLYSLFIQHPHVSGDKGTEGGLGGGIGEGADLEGGGDEPVQGEYRAHTNDDLSSRGGNEEGADQGGHGRADRASHPGASAACSAFHPPTHPKDEEDTAAGAAGAQPAADPMAAQLGIA